MRFVYILVSSIILSVQLYAQNKFISPVKYNMRLSGSFGELRTNHFHTGLDIKSSGSWEQDKAICVSDGYISRIAVKPEGYGNAVYVDHPNGLTSVYAHLYSFNKEIAAFVKDIQYKNQRFVIDTANLHIPVKQGEILGQIGNSGTSFGRHLHFELRGTETEYPVNPFKYGIKPKDDKAPVLTKIKIVALDTSYNSLNKKIYNLKRVKNGVYSIAPSQINFGAWRVGLQILGFDQMNGAWNKNGIYSIKLKVDNEVVYSYSIDSLDFYKQNNLNGHIDYEEFLINKSRYTRLYTLPGNNLNIYGVKNKEAIISLYKDKPRKIEIIATDYDGNKSSVKFSLKRDENILKPQPKLFNHKLKYGKNHNIIENSFAIKIDSQDIFKDMFLFLSLGEMQNDDYSDEIRIYTNDEVFKDYIDLSIVPKKIDSNLDKLCIIRLDDKGNINLGGEYIDGSIRTKIKEKGTYKIAVDSVAPTIKLIGALAGLSKKNKVSFTIEDNFDIGGKAKELTYNGYIDGEWVLFEYDKKNKKLTHRFDSKLNKGKHILKLVVEDNVGNINIFEKTFVK